MDGDDHDPPIGWADIMVTICDGEPGRSLALGDQIAAPNPAVVDCIIYATGFEIGTAIHRRLTSRRSAKTASRCSNAGATG